MFLNFENEFKILENQLQKSSIKENILNIKNHLKQYKDQLLNTKNQVLTLK